MDDQTLRARFRALADDDARRTPAFPSDQSLARRRSMAMRRTRRGWQAAGVFAVTSAAAAAVFTIWPRQPQLLLDLSGVTWTAPSDFLLETPGSEYLSRLPTIDIPPVPSVGEPTSGDDTSRREQ